MKTMIKAYGVYAHVGNDNGDLTLRESHVEHFAKIG